jgi:hypothetical protein
MRQDIFTKQFVYKLVIALYWGLTRNICWKGSHCFSATRGRDESTKEREENTSWS